MTVTEVNGSKINTTINNTAKIEKKIATAKVEELIDEESEITLEDLAPDGGWGWMIALAMILNMVSIILVHDRYNSIIETYIYIYIYIYIYHSLPTNNICLKIF